MARVKELQEYAAQCLAECFATFLLILIGEGSLAQNKFAGKLNHSPLTINISFGIGVYTALMIAGPISGAHLNPAVSISFLTVRKLKPLQCVFYIVGQMVGAFLGALVVYLVYWNLFDKFDGGIRQITGNVSTADIFFTMPAEGVSHGTAFFDQIVGTALLMVFIMALVNDYNHMISEVAKPFAFLLIIVAITSAFAGNAGAAINPARDLGPRLFAAIIYGWKNVFSAHRYFFWIPIVGPILGAILGVWLYESYMWVLKRFGNLPKMVPIGSIDS